MRITMYQLILGMLIAIFLLVIVIVESAETPGGRGRIWGIGSRPERHTPPIGGCQRIFAEAWTTQHHQTLQFEMRQVDLTNLYTRREDHGFQNKMAYAKPPGVEHAKKYNELQNNGYLSMASGDGYQEVVGYLGIGQVHCGTTKPLITTLKLMDESSTHVRELCKTKWTMEKDKKGNQVPVSPGQCSGFEDDITDNIALDMKQEAQTRCVFVCCYGKDFRGMHSAVAHCPVDVTMTWNKKNPFSRENGNLVPRHQITESAMFWTNIFYACCVVDVLLLCSLIAMGFVFLNRYM